MKISWGGKTKRLQGAIWAAVLGGTTLVAACGPVETGAPEVGPTAGAVSSGALAVDFSGCREFAGIGTVPAARARPLVPAHYTLAGDASNAVIVVRVSDCSGVAVDGHKPAAARVSQIGISVTGQDTTASINNYTLWYATDLGLLHAKLTGAGINADVDQGIVFQLAPGAACATGSANLAIGASPPHGPPFTACGAATLPTAPPTTFIATWWQDVGSRSVAMRTTFPSIAFGTANMTLTTPAGSALASLIGGTTLTFAFLDSLNTFATAHMTVQ